MQGQYRVFYSTPSGDGFYSIGAVSALDAIEEGRRLARAGYGDDATVTGARLLPSGEMVTAADAIEEDARARGREDGTAAGSWIVDGNTSEETARAIVRGIEDGDPMVMDALPSAPLSGEFADGLLPRDVLGWYDMDEDDDAADDVLRAYEDGFSEGAMDEAERSARAMLTD